MWEVVAVLLDNGGDVGATTEYLELPLGLVQAAAEYYGAHPREIDDWIELNATELAEAQEAFEAGQAALRR